MSPWPVYWLVFCTYGVIYKYEPRPLVEYLSQSPAPYKTGVGWWPAIHSIVDVLHMYIRHRLVGGEWYFSVVWCQLSPNYRARSFFASFDKALALGGEFFWIP